MRQNPFAKRGAAVWPDPEEQRPEGRLPSPGRRPLPQGRRLLLVATPFLLLAGVLSGTLLLRPQTPDADAARCTPTITLGTASVSPADPAAGTATTIKAQLSASCGRTAMFAFDVYDGTGKLVTQMAKQQTLYKGSHAYTATWQVPASQAAGTYEVRLGVFSPTWQTLYAWFNKVATITVGGAASSPTPTPPGGTPPAGTPPSGIIPLHVSGNRLVDTSGQPVNLYGVDKSGTEYACIQGWGIFSGPDGSDTAFIQTMVARHVHLVRIPMNEDCWLNVNMGGSTKGGSTYQQAIKQFVTALNTAGIYALLDLHWAAPGSTQATYQTPMPDADHSVTFWQQVAAAFANQPGVIFDLYNEPYQVGWDCWKNGGACSADNLGYNAAGMQTLITAVRNTGANNLIMVEGLDWANDLTQMNAYWPSDPAGNTVAEAHIYDSNSCATLSCWQQQNNPVAAKHPLFIGEFGIDTATFGPALVKWADSTAGVVGFAGWAYNSGFGNYSMLQSDDATLTSWGQWMVAQLTHEDASSSVSPTPSPTATATVTATSTPGGGTFPQPPAGGATPAGATLPTEAQCAAAIPASSWEPRPENATANHSVPTAAQIAGLAPWDSNSGTDPEADALRKQITGNYTGTTDQILQWAACKWGIDPNIARAQAVLESWWRQGTTGDLTSDSSVCPPGAATANGGCYQSYGLLQIMWQYNQSAWPMSRDDTAFSVEYALGRIRACYEGWMPWLSSRTPLAGYPGYHAGDIWGCLGYWNSGGWYNQQAINYINQVKQYMQTKPWLQSGF